MCLVLVFACIAAISPFAFGDLYFAGNDTLTWAASLTFCESFGSSLASIHSFDEYNAALNVCQDINVEKNTEYACWLGLNDIQSESVWQWSDGSALSFGFDVDGQPVSGSDTPPWAEEEPNNFNGEDCVEVSFWASIGVGMNDISCDTLNYAMCNAADELQYFVSDELMNWTQALAYCESFGTSLASIHSLNDSLAALDTPFNYATDTHCWIGLNKLPDASTPWQWADGTAVDFGFTDTGSPISSFYQWRLQEPNNEAGDEFCVEYYGYISALNDNDCTVQQYPICNAVTSPPTTSDPTTSNPSTAAPSQDPTTQPHNEISTEISVTLTTTRDTNGENDMESSKNDVTITTLIIIIASVVVVCGGFLFCSIFLILRFYQRQISRAAAEGHENEPRALSMSDLKVVDDRDETSPTPQPGMMKGELAVAFAEQQPNNQDQVQQTMAKQGEISTTNVSLKMQRPSVIEEPQPEMSSSYCEDMYDSVDKNDATTKDDDE